MRKFLLSFVLCFSLLLSLSLAVTIDLSEYNLPDLDTGSDTIYSNQILFYNQNSWPIYIFSSTPMLASSSGIYSNNNIITCYVADNSYTHWNLSEEAEPYNYIDEYTGYTDILFSNYTVYDYEDNSVIIYQPTQEEGGEIMSQVLTDLTTVMTSVLSNATSLVTWITSNPLVYLWVIMAIIIAIIAFVRGFIRGV